METTVNKHRIIFISDKAKKIMIDITIYLFVVLFIYTATDKFWNMRQFLGFTRKLEFLNYFPVFFAWAIPSIEVLISVLLITPKYRFIGMISSLGIMTGFTTYLIYMRLTYPTLPCSCGGVISKMNWTQHIWFNVVLIILAIITILAQIKTRQKEKI